MARIDLNELKRHYGIVGRDEKLDSALDVALQVARTNLSVLIQGESGVGKEAIPHVIHDHSLRKGKAYIAINCGSIPEGTIDSELFGHVKGAFTGSVADHDGYFGAANGGTLFLDEVGELPLSTQVRLLRVLENGEYVPVGSNQPRKTDVRIVAATNVEMGKAIREGRFREDLYYRLCTISINMPPLRERGEDVVLLFKKFALDTARTYQIPEPLRLTPEAEEVLKQYSWPGNIRQLKNVVEQMSILQEDHVVTPQVLVRYNVSPDSECFEVVPTKTDHRHSETLEQTVEVMKMAIHRLAQDVEMLKQRVGGMDERMTPHIIRQLEAPKSYEAAPEPLVHIPARTVISIPNSEEEVQNDEDLNIANMEKRMIVKALKKNKNRRKNAAQDLGLSERTLYRKIKDYGLEE